MPDVASEPLVDCVPVIRASRKVYIKRQIRITDATSCSPSSTTTLRQFLVHYAQRGEITRSSSSRSPLRSRLLGPVLYLRTVCENRLFLADGRNKRHPRVSQSQPMWSQIDCLGSPKEDANPKFAVWADQPCGTCHDFYYYEVTLHDIEATGKTPEVNAGFGIFLGSGEDTPARWLTFKYRHTGVVSCAWVGDGRSTSFTIKAPFGPGDTIGCGYRRRDRHIIATKNGKFVDTPVPHPSNDEGQSFIPDAYSLLWPTLEIEKAKMPMRLSTNFGQSPFLFDIESHFGFGPPKRSTTTVFLPPEMVDLVLQSVVEDLPPLHWTLDFEHRRIVSYHRSTLGRLSLVSNAWSKVCRPLLFSMLVLSCGSELRGTASLLRPSRGVPGGRFVKTLWVKSSQTGASTRAHPALNLELLAAGKMHGHLPVLHELIWDAADSPKPVTDTHLSRDVVSPHAAVPALLRVFQSVGHLSIRSKLYSSFTRMVLAISAVPKLTSLETMDVLWPAQVDGALYVPPTWLKGLEYLRRLDVLRCPSTHAVPYLWLFLLPSRPRDHKSALDPRPVLYREDAVVIARLAQFLIDGLNDGKYYYSKNSSHYEMSKRDDGIWELILRGNRGRAAPGNMEVIILQFFIKEPQVQSSPVPGAYGFISELVVRIDFDIPMGRIGNLKSLCEGFEALFCQLSNWQTCRCRFGSVDIHAFLQPHETPEVIRDNWKPVAGYMPKLYEAGVLHVEDPPTQTHPRYIPKYQGLF